MNIKISGQVQRGAERGRALGYPTANLELTDSGLPDGIYISTTEVAGQVWPSLTFIGEPKTFDDPLRRVETFLIGFDGDLYGQTITLDLQKKIRDNQAFDSAEALIEQMADDYAKACRFHGLERKD